MYLYELVGSSELGVLYDVMSLSGSDEILQLTMQQAKLLTFAHLGEELGGRSEGLGSKCGLTGLNAGMLGALHATCTR